MVQNGIRDSAVHETPIAVIDFETTGLNPGADRVVEATVARIEPGAQPKTVFDTLINPRRRMAATEIHGITDDDVADAPVFADIAARFVDSIAGCVVASYNVYFDIKFLEYELAQTGFTEVPPHLCLMYLRPLLGLGKRCSLAEACRAHGLEYAKAHTALGDTTAACELMRIYLEVLPERGIRTFNDLAQLKSYKFLNSFARAPLDSPCDRSARRSQLRSRTVTPQAREAESKERPEKAVTEEESLRRALHGYWDALKVVIADLRVTDEEVLYLLQTKRDLGLRDEQTRVLHARAFVSVLSQFTADQWLDDKECKTLRKLHASLSRAGWAPGD